MEEIKNTKICSMCKIEKPIQDFYKRRDNGYISCYCKKCTIERSNNYRLNSTEEQLKNRKKRKHEYDQKNKRDINQWYSNMYRSMKIRNRSKFGLELPFSLEEFTEWININYKDIFVKMFQEYVDNNCDKYLKPSIDRIDDYKGYSLDNMQLLTWRENDIKGTKSQKNKESCAKIAKEYLSKVVLQYDLNDNFIAKFDSTHDVERQLGFDSSSIAKVCRFYKEGKINRTAYGYKWRYEEDIVNAAI